MDEAPGNQDNLPFLGNFTGAMFYGEQSAGCSSLEAGWVPMSERIPAQHDIAMARGNWNGLGIMDNANLFDEQALVSAFGNMGLSLTGNAAADSSAHSGTVGSRDGLLFADSLFTSADYPTNLPHQPAFGQDEFVPSYFTVHNAGHMKTKFGAQNPPMYTGMHGTDNAFVTRTNLPQALSFQQHHIIDTQPQTYAPCYQQMDYKFKRHDIDAETNFFMQPQYPYQQYPQAADVHWINSNQYGFINSSDKYAAAPHRGVPTVRHLGHGSPDIYRNGAVIPNGSNRRGLTHVNNCPFISYPDCLCETCEYCQIRLSENLKRSFGPRHSPKCSLDDCISDKAKSSPSSLDSVAMKSAQLPYSSVDEVVGELYHLAKDQNGCRFLQRIFIEGSREDARKVFDGVIEHIDELMVDPFGNYLIQKIFEKCNDNQKMHILYEITKIPGQLIEVACNMHGTRVVQKVIESISTSDEVSMVVSALSHGAITLMMDSNGCHVAERCLLKLSPEGKAFLVNAATKYCVELAKDRQGCCIIQKCIAHASKEQRNRLLYSITTRALELAEDEYGNYVIQFVLGLGVAWATNEVLDKLEGSYGYLSTQKCSSNVVEKCLREAPERERARIILELIHDPRLLNVLVDKYGNYVIQTALRESEGTAVEAALIRAIKPHAGALRNNMYGKRVLSKACLKSRKP
ncbi:Pumilio 12 [Zea mays]|uniref:Pumilio 12 n=1 Tax=Zea mays TaxID=4577 RepID=A0A3L6GC61_MAIZE|nr:Pumilio 12 [Zea mays]